MMSLLATEKTAVLVITGFIAVLMAATLARSGHVDPGPERPAANDSVPADPWTPPHREESSLLRMANDGEAGVGSPGPSQSRFYTVQRGDTLESIARKELGSRSKISVIQSNNPGLRPLNLKVGHRLLLPTTEAAERREDPRTLGTRPPATSSPRYHVVARGETLGSIAQRYYDRAGAWMSIYEANRSRIADPNRLTEGLRLQIPALIGRRERVRP